MYLIGEVFINPLQVESIKYYHEKLVLNTMGDTRKRAIVKMASGDEFRIDHDTNRDVDAAVKELVWQIDVSNGMTFTTKKEGEDESS